MKEHIQAQTFKYYDGRQNWRSDEEPMAPKADSFLSGQIPLKENPIFGKIHKNGIKRPGIMFISKAAKREGSSRSRRSIMKRVETPQKSPKAEKILF